MAINDIIMHINKFLFLLSIPYQDQKIYTWTVSARQGPCTDMVFFFTNGTKKYIPLLVIPRSFMVFHGSLHPLTGVR